MMITINSFKTAMVYNPHKVWQVSLSYQATTLAKINRFRDTLLYSVRVKQIAEKKLLDVELLIDKTPRKEKTTLEKLYLQRRILREVLGLRE